MDTWQPQLVRMVHSPKAQLSLDIFQSFGIRGYFDNQRNTSTRIKKKEYSMVSPSGKLLGIDEKDFLYFQEGNKHHRLLNFKVFPQPPMHLRWLPGENYVIMTCPSLGILILNPQTGAIGKIIEAEAFGWYEKY